MMTGGAKPSVRLRLESNLEMLTIQVEESLARDLGKRLYDTVGLIGKAEWDVDTGEIISFRGSEISPFKPQKRGIADAFREMAAMIAPNSLNLKSFDPDQKVQIESESLK